MSVTPQEQVPLAPLTSLKLGGPARYFVAIHERAQLLSALQWADQRQQPIAILGGGSNLVVSDLGFAGLVLRMETRGIQLTQQGAHTLLRAEAGEPWQAVVDCAVANDLAGLECLTGIPGSAGATPIQNVGAYGQEVADTLREVEVLDRQTGQLCTLSRDACEFAYRDSLFKRQPARFVVLSVTFALTPHGAPKLAYAELTRALGAGAPTLQHVANTVWQLRAQKSMLLDETDENGRSAGSFFKNPIVNRAEAERVVQLCVTQNLVKQASEVPQFAVDDTHVKLAAGFLIERAGIHKGLRQGAVGVSSKHALCLVHHGGGTSSQLLALAQHIEQQVALRFGVQLEREPVLW